MKGMRRRPRNVNRNYNHDATINSHLAVLGAFTTSPSHLKTHYLYLLLAMVANKWKLEKTVEMLWIYRCRSSNGCARVVSNVCSTNSSGKSGWKSKLSFVFLSDLLFMINACSTSNVSWNRLSEIVQCSKRGTCLVIVCLAVDFQDEESVPKLVWWLVPFR